MKKFNIIMASIATAVLSLTSCSGDEVLPPVAYPDGGSCETIGTGNWDDPYPVWQVLAGAVMPDNADYVWTTGYIVGYINTFDGDYAKLREKSAVFSASGAPNSNLMLADSPDETDWQKCIPVQLAYGTAGRDLSLQKTPDLLGRQVTLRGTTGSKYLSVYGVRNCDAFEFGDKGFYEAPPTVFTRAAEIESGAIYSLVAGGTYQAKPIDQNRTYGYLYVAEVKASGNSFKSALTNGITITAEEDGYTIVDAYGRYLFMSGTSNSFDVAEEKPASGFIWNITLQDDGTFMIKNRDRGHWIQYSEQYTSYGTYSDSRGLLPALFKAREAE